MKPKSILALCGASANRQPSITLALAITALLSGPQAHGAVKTWVGNTDATFGAGANWSASGTPVTGDSFVFGAAGSSGTTLTSALTSFSAAGFTFNSGASAFTIGGTAMTLTGNITNNSTALQTINLNLATTAVRTVNANTGGITLGGVISGTNGGITKTGSGTLILSGANSYTGATTISAGILNITGAMTTAAVGLTTVNGGTILLSGANGRTGAASTAGIVVNQNGSFIIDNSTNNNNARVQDAAQTTLNGGVYEFRGSTTTDTADTMGTFNLGGPSTITLTRGSASYRTEILAAGLSYTAGTGATLVSGINLGRATTPTTGNTYFKLTAAPMLVGTTAGLSTGINSVVYNTSIVPFLLGESTSTTGGTGTATGAANTFVTYSATGGLRPLNLTDEFDTSATLVGGNNVRVASATSVASNVAINSMILDSAGVSINDGVTLTNTSGALMFSSTNSIAPAGTTGALAFGTSAAQITVLPTFTGTISAGISGTGGLVKNGTGNLILSGTGSYTGPTSVNGGTVSFTGASTPSDSASALVVNNPNRSAGNAVVLNLSTTLPSSVGSLSGTISTPSSGTNTAKINNGGRLLTINQTTAGIFDGTVEGAGGLTKNGSSSLSITNATYSGPTIISVGTLEFNRSGASGNNTINVGSGVTVASGATLAIRALGTTGTTSTITAPISLTGNGVANSLDFPGGNNQGIAITGGISVSGGAMIHAFGLINTYTISGVGITGDATTSGLVFRTDGGNSNTNAHTVNFNVASTYTGDTTLNAVSQRTTFKLGVNDALPTTTSLNLIGGTGGTAGSTFANLDLNGKNQTLAGLTTTANAGGANILNSVTTASTLTVNSTTNSTIAGVLGGGAANNNNFLLTKSGTGILSLSGLNTYTGATAVNEGTLSLLNTGAKSASAITVASGATLGLGVSAAASPFTSANVDSLFAGTLSGVTNHATSNVGIDTTGGNFTYATSVASTTRGLTKLGLNTLTLSGANNYTGETLITGGTLALAAGGSIDNTSSVSLGTVGTFDVSAKSGYAVSNLTGSGNVTGALTVSTQLAIGNSPGTTNFSSGLTLDSAVYLYDMTGGLAPGAGSADLGNVGGLLTISAGSILDLVELGTYTAGNKFTLFSYGTLSGTFDGLANNANFLDDLSNTWQIKYDDTTAGLNGGTGSNFITITAVPEPNAAMLVGGLGMLALLRRRRG